MKDTNVRITHWYLALQPFKFNVGRGKVEGCSRRKRVGMSGNKEVK